MLNAGRRIAMLVGAGCAGAAGEVAAVADRLGAGCAKALPGKAVLPDDLPWVTGAVGLPGTEASSDMMAACDTLLMVGSGFPWAELLPKEGQAHGVQIDLKADRLSIRYPLEVNPHGDAAETLRALLPLLTPKPDRAWRDRVERGTRKSWAAIEDRAGQPANPVNPRRVVGELSSRLPERCTVTSDSGSCVNWFARDLRLRRGMMASLLAKNVLSALAKGDPREGGVTRGRPGRCWGPSCPAAGEGSLPPGARKRDVLRARSFVPTKHGGCGAKARARGARWNTSCASSPVSLEAGHRLSGMVSKSRETIENPARIAPAPAGVLANRGGRRQRPAPSPVSVTGRTSSSLPGSGAVRKSLWTSVSGCCSFTSDFRLT